MAITKARTSSPVRGYYVTTIFTGRTTQLSGAGFGLPRLGGLINAQVDGLVGGGSAATRLAAQAPRHEYAEAKLEVQRKHAEEHKVEAKLEPKPVEAKAEAKAEPKAEPKKVEPEKK